MENVIKDLRYKFILLCTGCVALVLLCVVGAINTANVVQQRIKINNMLEFLTEHDGRFGSDAKQFEDLHINEESAYTTRFFIGQINQNNELFKMNSENVASLTTDEIVSYIDKALSKGKVKGRIGMYYYLLSDTEYGKKVVFLDSSQYLRTNSSLMLVSLIVAFSVLAAVMFLITMFSQKAMKPYVENMEKQRRFVTDAGHEIKTPLAIIAANAEVLAMSEGENEWIESIQNQTKRLSKLVSSLVTLSKMDEERVKFDIKEFFLSDACAEVYDAFKVLAERKNRTLTEQIQDGIKYVGDENSLRELTSILLDNAIKYSLEGSEISISLTQQKNGIVLETTNKTDGVEQENLSKLFDRFYRPDASRSRETGGFGIGLSIAEAIVTAHKGKIKASSDDGTNIKFTVNL